MRPHSNPITGADNERRVNFQKTFNAGTPYQRTNQPSGTNILDAEQATAMVRYMVEGMPDGSAVHGGDFLEHSNQSLRKP